MTFIMRLVFLLPAALQAAHAMAESPGRPFVMLNHRFVVHEAKQNFFQVLPKGSAPRTGLWKGLFCRGLDCEIAGVDVKVVSGKVEYCGGGDSEPAEFIAVAGSPIAIFNSLPLKDGKVSTQLRAINEKFASSHFLKLYNSGKWELASGNETLSLSWVRSRPSDPESAYLYQYRYHLLHGSTKQFIFSVMGTDTPEVTPFVHWAGDLDDDGKLDLLVEIPYSMSDQTQYYCQFSERVYLSSLARKGEVLRKAGEVSGGIPACGC